MKGKIEISIDEANAILAVKGGADVYNYSIAKSLREMERRGVKDLFEITKPMMYKGDGTDQMPYFGCIATKKGIRVANARARESLSELKASAI